MTSLGKPRTIPVLVGDVFRQGPRLLVVTGFDAASSAGVRALRRDRRRGGASDAGEGHGKGGKAMSAPAPLKRPGETLVWSAGVGAYQESKRGTVIAVLPAGTSLRAAIAATGREPVRVKVGDTAKSDRYVVEVQTVHGPAYYAPLVKTVDADLRLERELRAKLPVEAWR